MNKIIKNKKGFTLTELIVVIAIIGILAAVLIPSVIGYIKKSQKSADYQEANGIHKILENYISERNGQITSTTSFYDYYYEITEKRLEEGTCYILLKDVLAVGDNPYEDFVSFIYFGKNNVVIIQYQDKAVSYENINKYQAIIQNATRGIYQDLALLEVR